MTIKQNIQKILEQLSEEDTKEYIESALQKNKKLRDLFLLQFDHLLDEKPSPSKYRKLVKQMIKMHSGRHGYIEYRNAKEFRQDIMALLD